MSDIDQAALLEILAGKNRANTAMAILSNTTDLEEAYVSALEAEGSALKENETYLDSIQGKIDLFNNALQTMWSNTLDSSLIKGFVEFGTTLVKIIDWLGMIPTLLIAIGSYKGIGALFNTFKDSGVTLKSVLTYLNSLTVGFQKNAIAQTAVNAATLKQDIVNKLLKNTIIQRLAAEQLDGQLKEANLAREVRLVAAKQALALAEELYAEGLIDDIALQAAKNAVDAASVPITLSQFSATTLLGAAFKGLAVSIWAAVKAIAAFLFTNPIGWMILLVGAIAGGIAAISGITQSTEELKEELSDLKTELEDIQAELDSLNAELETTQSRMAELLAMDSLSFTEKEELRNLQKQNDELERSVYLLEQQQKRKQKQTEETFDELMHGVFNDGNATMGVSTGFTDAMMLGTYISQYRGYLQEVEEAAQELESAKQSGDDSDIKRAQKKLEKAQKKADKMEKIAADTLEEYSDAAEGIDYNLADEQTKEYLDWIYNTEDRFNIYSGDEQAKSIAITRIFNKEDFANASETIDTLVEKLKQNPGDATIINQIRQQCQLAEEDLKAVGLSVDDAVASFTMFASDSSFDTVERKLNELSDASSKFNILLHGATFEVDGVDTGLAGLFDEEGKIIQTKLSQIFKDTDEQTRKDITSVLEGAYDTIKDGLNDDEIAQLTTKLGFKFSRAIMEVQKQELFNDSIELFPGLEEEISGIIDTFDELVKSVGSVVDALDALDQARAEEAYSGSVSLETLSKLMASTENYADLIEVDETGAIKLAANAQEILVQQKIDAIKKNAELALADAELALQEAIHAEQTYTQTGPAQEFLRGMTMEVGGAVAFVSSLWNDLINGNWNGAWDRAVSARDTSLASSKSSYAAEAAEASASVVEAQKRVENAEKMNKIAQGLTPENVKTRYSSDEASGGAKTTEDALQKKYEDQIKNLENKQTYLQNKIDLLEAQNEGVSKSYYEEQINLEQQKLNLYAQELEALKQLERTDEVAEALWETEHAIQESTLRMVEFRKSIIDLYDEAFSNIAEAYDNKDDFFEDQQSYIDKYQQLMELQGSPEAATGYYELQRTEEAQLVNNIAKLEALKEARDAAYANSDIKQLSDEQWVAMEDEIRAVEAAILDNKIALEEYKQELKSLYVDAFNSIRDAFNFKDEFYTNQQDYIEGYADYLEAIGVDAPRELYDTLIEIEQKKRDNAFADLQDAREGLTYLEAKGFTAADEEWQDAYNQIVALEKKIQDSDIAMAQWEQTIRDMDFEKFERFISRLDDINSEIEHIQNLLSDEDVAFEDGTWTEEGITSLGLLYQQMQLAQQQSKEYAEEIDELNATYAEGAMSEQEYYERLQELKEGQWDAIELYEDAKDAIVDMEEARIDMIEEGINEEIEAYQELIDLKKKELDAERDLYEFKKNIKDQTKDIASLERRIAAMSGSTDASTIAERTKLEAELRKAQEGLDDTYYTHAKDMQSQALDDEATSYQEAKENYLETLRDALDDTAAIIEAKISEFLLNADVGLEELNGISQEHGITLSDALMLPWQNASEISSAFKLTADENLGSLINEDGVVTFFNTEATRMLQEVFSSAGSAAQLFNSDVETVVGNIKTIVENSTSPLTADLALPWEDTAGEDGPIKTFSAGVEEAIDGVINKAKTNCETIKTYLSSPFTAAELAADTFKTNAIEDLDAVILKAKEAAREIANAANTETPNYTGSPYIGGGGTDDASGGKTTLPQLPGPHTKTPSEADVKALQTCLNMLFSSGLTVDGKLGAKTKAAIQSAQKTMYYAGNETMKSQDGLYGAATRAAMVSYINKKIESLKSQGGSSMIGQAVQRYNTIKNTLPKAFYASGTTGTKQDELAVVDEIGEELILAAGGNGRLQYLRKGSGVIPADLTANLMEWGKLNPNTDMSSAVQGVNVMTSVLNKPETNLIFENLLHIDNCTNEVLPEVKKIITEQLESFTKKLNYNLKRVGSKA